jgi:hypothetical protein
MGELLFLLTRRCHPISLLIFALTNKSRILDLGEGGLKTGIFLPCFRIFRFHSVPEGEKMGGDAGGGKNGHYQTHYYGTES